MLPADATAYSDLFSLLIGAWVLAAIVTAAVAYDRGRSFIGWLLMAALISPLMAAVLLIAAGAGNRGKQPCPDCAEMVWKEARVCRFCRRDLAADRAHEAAERPSGRIGRILGWH